MSSNRQGHKNLDSRQEELRLLKERMRDLIQELSGDLAGLSHQTRFSSHVKGEKRERLDLLQAFSSMSPRQHAALQMLIRGADKLEISKRLVVDTIEIDDFLSSIFCRLGVDQRDPLRKKEIAIRKVEPLLEDITADDYFQLTGIPENWDFDYEKIGAAWDSKILAG